MNYIIEDRTSTPHSPVHHPYRSLNLHRFQYSHHMGVSENYGP